MGLVPRGDKGRFARIALLSIGLLAGTLVAVFVWPTAYRLIPVQTSNPGVFAAREQRFTGRVELLTRRGWQPTGDLLDEYRALR